MSKRRRKPTKSRIPERSSRIVGVGSVAPSRADLLAHKFKRIHMHWEAVMAHCSDEGVPLYSLNLLRGQS